MRSMSDLALVNLYSQNTLPTIPDRVLNFTSLGLTQLKSLRRGYRPPLDVANRIYENTVWIVHPHAGLHPRDQFTPFIVNPLPAAADPNRKYLAGNIYWSKDRGLVRCSESHTAHPNRSPSRITKYWHIVNFRMAWTHRFLSNGGLKIIIHPDDMYECPALKDNPFAFIRSI